jgi:hypothetical protein
LDGLIVGVVDHSWELAVYCFEAGDEDGAFCLPVMAEEMVDCVILGVVGEGRGSDSSSTEFCFLVSLSKLEIGDFQIDRHQHRESAAEP